MAVGVSAWNLATIIGDPLASSTFPGRTLASPTAAGVGPPVICSAWDTGRAYCGAAPCRSGSCCFKEPVGRVVWVVARRHSINWVNI